MEKEQYYPEEILVAKVQNGEYGWLEYVCHHSKEWKQEYDSYCRKRGLPMNDKTAWQFIEMKQEEFEQGIADGEA